MAKQYGKWNVLESVGQGGQAHVFVVADSTGTVSERRVLKRLLNVNDAARRSRFQKEVEATQAIRHPNVLRVYESDLNGKDPYYIAEYCERGSLEKIGAAKFKGNIRRTIDVVTAVADALVAANQVGVIHRDIKPANILFREEGTPVLGDFGICHVEGGEPVTLSDEAMGSLNYIAPEMESGSSVPGGPTDQTDVYSLGKVLYWMLSGGRIFAREGHRNNPLTKLLGDKRFEHVHMLLDRMVVQEPAARLRGRELKEELRMTGLLTEKGYAPLKPSIGIPCRFCGIGQYKKHAEYDWANKAQQGPQGDFFGLGLEAHRAGADLRVLRCDNCGHVEIFQFHGIRDREWWNK